MGRGLSLRQGVGPSLCAQSLPVFEESAAHATDEAKGTLQQLKKHALEVEPLLQRAAKLAK